MEKLFTVEINLFCNGVTTTTLIDNCTFGEISTIKNDIMRSLQNERALHISLESESIFIPYDLLTKSLIKIIEND